MTAACVLGVQLLGGFTVRVAGQLVAPAVWRQRRAAGIVKLLALADSHRLHREQLLETLWPEFDPNAGTNNLRVALHHARRGLELAGAPPQTFLVRDGDSLLLGPKPQVAIDAAEFVAAASLAWQTEDPVIAQRAVALFRGDLLPEDLYEEWVAARREAFHASYLTLLSRLASLYEARGEFGRAIAAREQAISADPCDEAAHADLMRLHARMGNAALALSQYTRLQTLLERELGIEPERATRELAAAIRDGRFAPAAVAMPASALPSSETVNLPAAARVPAPVDQLVGREQELAELARLLTSARLVTLTGPGGTGKTRLAQEVARANENHFPDGVAFVDLVPLHDPALVLSTVARVLGIEEAGESSLHDLQVVIGERRLLIVLDNVEQVIAAAPEIAALLASSPRLTVLTTSRVRLRLRGEQEYPVSPLALPPVQERGPVPALPDLERFPAVELFVHRARAARPAFALTAENARAVTAVCRKLDGLPLAIELAAARVRVLAPDQLLQRLSSPLDALGSPVRDVPSRQRTLRETIAWSYNLLTPEAQTVFRRLGVFVGGWTLEDAQVVLARGNVLSRDVLPTLEELVDHSLVTIRAGTSDMESRFGMLETIREFAVEQLAAAGESENIRRKHLACFLTLATAARRELSGPQQGAWLNQLTSEHDNMRAALQHALDTEDGDTALRLSTSLWLFWAQRGHLVEGRGWLERALAIAGGTTPEVRGDALHCLGNVAIDLHDYQLAQVCFEQGLEIWRHLADEDGIAVELNGLGIVARSIGDFRRARAHFERCLQIWRTAGATPKIASALHNLGDLACLQGEYADARALLEEALTLRRQLGDDNGVAYSLLDLGTIDLHEVGDGAAESRFKGSLSLFRELGDTQGEGYALYWLGRWSQKRDDERAAAALYHQSLVLRQESYDRQGIGDCLEGFAFVACHRGQRDLAACLLGAAQVIQESIGSVMSMADCAERTRILELVGDAMSGDECERAIAAGRELPEDQAIAMAFALTLGSDSLAEALPRTG